MDHKSEVIELTSHSSTACWLLYIAGSVAFEKNCCRMALTSICLRYWSFSDIPDHSFGYVVSDRLYYIFMQVWRWIV